MKETDKLAMLLDAKNKLKDLKCMIELLLNDIKLANYREYNANKKRFRTS